MDFMGESAAIQFLNGFNFSDGAISLPGGKTLAEQYAEYQDAQDYLLWLRFRETSGTDVANSGRLGGLTITWTPGAGALGQTGKLGANEAYSYDALLSRTRVSANATLGGLTTQKWAFLVKINSLGEGNLGHLFGWSAGAGGANTDFLLVQATNKLNCTIYTDTATDAIAVTNNGEIADIIGAGVFAWIFMDYDDDDTLGHGRKIRLFKGLNGTVTPLSLATDQAGTGSVISMAANNLGIFTTDAQAFTSDGVIDEAVIDDSLWTTEQMATLVALSGV